MQTLIFILSCYDHWSSSSSCVCVPSVDASCSVFNLRLCHAVVSCSCWHFLPLCDQLEREKNKKLKFGSSLYIAIYRLSEPVKPGCYCRCMFTLVMETRCAESIQTVTSLKCSSDVHALPVPAGVEYCSHAAEQKVLQNSSHFHHQPLHGAGSCWVLETLCFSINIINMFLNISINVKVQPEDFSTARSAQTNTLLCL